MKLYIAYGSDMNLEEMNQRCPKSQVYGKYKLDNYKMTFRGKGHANMEESEGGSIPILIWKITKECERELDKYKGYPDYYTKKEIPLEINGKILKALVYFMTMQKDDSRKDPSQEYFNTIRQGYIDNKFDLKILDKFYKENESKIREEIGEGM